MRHLKNDLARWWNRTGTAWWPPALLALAFAAGGCSSTAPRLDPAREPVQILLPKLTSAVTGPAASLLTNLDGFHCQFSINFGDPERQELTVTGELRERGGKLCFEPVFKPAGKKSPGAGGFILIWDAAGKQGYVLSDALQGVAPVAPDAGTAKPADFRVERSQDLNGLAVSIQSTDTLQPFTLTLSGIKPVPPPEGLFTPPDGFTKYDSETTLLDELATRQRTVMGPSKKDEGELGDYKINQPASAQPRTDTGTGN
jgi:hypothetical protein